MVENTSLAYLSSGILLPSNRKQSYQTHPVSSSCPRSVLHRSLLQGTLQACFPKLASPSLSSMEVKSMSNASWLSRSPSAQRSNNGTLWPHPRLGTGGMKMPFHRCADRCSRFLPKVLSTYPVPQTYEGAGMGNGRPIMESRLAQGQR